MNFFSAIGVFKELTQNTIGFNSLIELLKIGGFKFKVLKQSTVAKCYETVKSACVPSGPSGRSLSRFP